MTNILVCFGLPCKLKFYKEFFCILLFYNCFINSRLSFHCNLNNIPDSNTEIPYTISVNANAALHQKFACCKNHLNYKCKY